MCPQEHHVRNQHSNPLPRTPQRCRCATSLPRNTRYELFSAYIPLLTAVSQRTPLHLFAPLISVFRECPKSGWWRFAGRTVTPWPWKSPPTRGQCSSTRDTCSGCGTWTAGDTWTCLLVWLPSVWATAIRKVLCLRLLRHTHWWFIPMWSW